MKRPDLGVLGLDRLQAFASLGKPRIGTVRCLRGESHGGPITSTSFGVLVVGACVQRSRVRSLPASNKCDRWQTQPSKTKQSFTSRLSGPRWEIFADELNTNNMTAEDAVPLITPRLPKSPIY